ncbi:hypothetical protein DHEL01_v210791 [Diaporthe helianthi]|uniref:Uncharacterized protein n=1 Tax=Diaporthe helianthi TaxID=158607 RepID=A0A2P5HKQ4_DIAHE|nr:hypothetical protein DHEL01_v210791 [Diaporthe helianthi]
MTRRRYLLVASKRPWGSKDKMLQCLVMMHHSSRRMRALEELQEAQAVGRVILSLMSNCSKVQSRSEAHLPSCAQKQPFSTKTIRLLVHPIRAKQNWEGGCERGDHFFNKAGGHRHET